MPFLLVLAKKTMARPSQKQTAFPKEQALPPPTPSGKAEKWGRPNHLSCFDVLSM